MKRILLFLGIFISANTFAQKESWNWNFGAYAGVNFSSGAPVAFSGTAFNQMEGCASISDSSGNLLFYTNGLAAYDSTNTVMPNGSGLMGNYSSSQSAIAIKLPGSNTLYYLFTVDYNHDGSGIGNGLRYSIVDMSLNNGLGDVTIKNTLIRLPVYEKICAIRHANNTDFWIIINDWTNDDIFSYPLTSAGFDTIPVVSNAGPIHQMNIALTTGVMKASAQGDKLALALWASQSYELFNYDNSTGIASNPITLQANDMFWAYGIEFSPDGSKLYTTRLAPPSNLFQFDISSWNAATIMGTRVLIGSNPSQYHYCALQVAPDSKIYCSVSGTGYLGVINSPNVSGINCNYSDSGVYLGGNSCRYGLPSFVPQYVIPTGINALEDEVKTDIYPNPASDELNITINDKIKNAYYRITDIAGKQLSYSGMATGTARINTGNFENGIYFLQLKNNNQVINRKFIIQK